MKALATVALSSFLALGAAVPAGAAEYRVSDAVWKFSRGVVNTATGLPGEIAAHTILGTTSTDSVFGAVSGVVTGVLVGTGWGLLRVGSGLVDMVTFVAPVNHNRPLVEPEFAF